MNVLSAPPEVSQDPQAVELLRAWIVGGALECVLDTEAIDEPEPWGEVLAEVLQNVARARLLRNGTPLPETLGRVRAVFNQEVDALLANPAEEAAPNQGGKHEQHEAGG